MAINFPSNPSDGDTILTGTKVYTYHASKGVWKDSDGDDATQSTLDNYLEVANSSSIGVTAYSALSDLPLSGQSTGKMAYVSGTNRLYLWAGTGWYNIALVNTDPSISGASASYTLSKTGANTVVTLASTDPEGIPITFSLSTSGLGVGANAIATVTQSNNIFTFTPTTNTALAGTFTATFTASDGVNLAVANSSFTLAFSVNNSNYTTALITSVGTNTQDNNDFVDSSTNSHTITASGGATQSTFSPYRHGGYSTYFDGTGDYLTTSLTADHNVGTNSFTVEFWAYLNATGQFHPALGLGTDSSNGYMVDISSSNNVRLVAYIGGSWGVVITGGTALSANQWYHIAVVRDGNDFDIYLNGSSDATTVTNSGSITDPSGGNQVSVGGYQLASTAWRYFNGYISDLRFVNGTAVYTANFTPPTQRLTSITNTSLLACHLPYITGDVAPVGYTGSGSIVGSSASLDSGTLANAFDGSLSTSVAIRNSGSFIEFTFPQQQTGELQVNITNGNDVGDNNVQFWIDGVAGTSFDVSSQTWYSLTSSSDSFTTVKLEHSGSTTANIYGFRIGTSGDTIIGLRPDITINGDTTTVPFAPYDYGSYTASENGGSMYFDGNGDSLTIASDSSLYLDGDFTIEFWINNETIALDTQHPSPVTFAGNLGQIYTNSSNNYYGLYYDTGDIVTTGNNTAKTGVWQHVAFTRSGSTCYAFVDGVLKNTATSSQAFSSSTGTFRIGSYNGTGGDVNGNMSDIRIVKGTAVYTANFTPPTERLTSITNTSLLLNGTDAGIIDKSQSLKYLSLFGNASSSTTQAKYLSSSMKFDGTGDYIDIGLDAVSGCDFGTDDFTIEGWFHIPSLSTYYIADARNPVPSDSWAIFISSNRLYFYDGATSRQTTNAPATGQWQHFAITRESGAWRMFLDGSLEAGPTSVTRSINAGSRLRIAASGAATPGSPLNGYLSDFRITKGLARYTANFTAPTAALEG